MSARIDLGAFGETLVVKSVGCLRCKRGPGVLKRLPPNFKCADLICEFCGWLAQVKTHTSTDVDVLPPRLLGAAWEPQRQRMEAGIYFPLFIVAADRPSKRSAIHYLPADLQSPDLFRPRAPLGPNA